MIVDSMSLWINLVTYKADATVEPCYNEGP